MNRKYRAPIFWGLLYLTGSYFAYDFVFNVKMNPKENKCGIIIDKLQPQGITSHKHSSTVSFENQFVIQWESKEIESISNINANTWYKFDKGDRVCFDRFIDQPSSRVAYIIFSILMTVIIGFVNFGILVELFLKLYNRYID